MSRRNDRIEAPTTAWSLVGLSSFRVQAFPFQPGAVESWCPTFAGEAPARKRAFQFFS
jgi:hypothetical protein